jgi:nicotinamide-nucleotide adenylyltransferase
MDEHNDKRGLLIGRYQPFHNGHLEIIREIKDDIECSELVIAIGSAQESYTLENPFTAGERIIMIDRALRAISMKKYFLIPIPDLNMYAVWVAHVESLTPPIDIVYTNNTLTKRLFSERGYYVKSPTMYDRDKFSGTKIRQKMINGENWVDYVPENVAKVIEKLDGVKRLQELG